MILFYNIAFLKYIGGSDQVEVGKGEVYRATLDISGAGNNSKIHTSFHSPYYSPSNFLDIHQLSRDLGPILYSSLMNILLHISDRKFSSVNLTACFIDSFPYWLLQNPYSPTKSINHLWRCHMGSPHVLISRAFQLRVAPFLSCLLYSVSPAAWQPSPRPYCIQEVGG